MKLLARYTEKRFACQWQYELYSTIIQVTGRAGRSNFKTTSIPLTHLSSQVKRQFAYSRLCWYGMLLAVAGMFTVLILSSANPLSYGLIIPGIVVTILGLLIILLNMKKVETFIFPDKAGAPALEIVRLGEESKQFISELAFQIQNSKVFVLLINPYSQNEGIYTLSCGNKQQVLIFEDQEDATHYNELLAKKNFLGLVVTEIRQFEVDGFCEAQGYECKLVIKGTSVEPPQDNAITDFLPK